MRRLAGSLCSFGLGFSACCGLAAEDLKPAKDVVAVHSAAEGQQFAIGLRSTLPAVSVERHVILVDTSASQTGIYRDRSLAAVRQLLDRLPVGNQVRLLSADTEVTSLTDGFVPVGSTELKAAFERLAQITPLGATDLAAAIRSAAANASVAPTSIAYIGDGMSAADMLSADDLQQLISHLHLNRTAVHALLIGPRMDAHLSGILANQSGGSLDYLTEESETVVAAAAVGICESPMLISNLHATGGDIQLHVPQVVALRADRHTLIFGDGTLSASVTVTGKTTNGSEVSWDVSSQALTAGGAGVAALAEKASQTNGLNAPYVGLGGLDKAEADLAALIGQSINAAQQLRDAGHIDQALQVVRQAQRLDAGNIQLTSMAAALVDEDERPIDRPGAPDVSEGNALSRTEVRNAIITQQMVQAVNAALEEADRVASTQPEYSLTLLKDVLEAVRTTAEIAPEKRQELERRIVAAYSDVDSARQTSEIRQRQIAEARANLEAQRERLAMIDQDEQKLRTLIDQVRGLLVRARQGDVNAFEDAEAVAREALQDEPGNGTATAALVMSEASGQLSKAYDLVNLRNDRFLETLYQVELSHVPFPDEPPVQYPNADVWRALSIARKERYKSLSLRSVKKVEEWLERKLDEPLPRPLQYPGDESLGEILRFIADAYTAEGPYTMRIILDESDVEIGEDPEYLDNTTVSNVDLAGITMRNALELIFAKVKDSELTVMIKNEVMMVTTVATAESEENLVTRIYDVADLVVITQAGMGAQTLVRIQCPENSRVPAQGSSAQGQSGPKVRPKGVIDGKKVYIPSLV